jgi:hypothetical protein
MEPIADLAALRPIVDSLVAKKLVAYLTPQQRGAVVTHLLYQPQELEKVRRIHADGAFLDHGEPMASAPAGAAAPVSGAVAVVGGPASPTRSVSEAVPSADLATLKNQLRELFTEVQQLRSALDSATGELRRDLDDVRRQLGIS